MNQSFNLARFGQLFRKHTVEHGSGYLLGVGVLLGVLGALMGFLAYVKDGPFEAEEQAVCFVLGLLGVGTFFTSTLFADYGDRRRATAALLLPASQWEKYLVGWLYALPLFLAAYIGCFYLVDSVVLALDNWAGPRPALVPLFSNESHLYLSLLVYTLLSAGFLWGSIFFRRQHFVRTAFSLILGLVALWLANSWIGKALVSSKISAPMPLSPVRLEGGTMEQAYRVALTPEMAFWLAAVPLLLLLLLAWWGTYAQLTEKQI